MLPTLLSLWTRKVVEKRPMPDKPLVIDVSDQKHNGEQENEQTDTGNAENHS